MELLSHASKKTMPIYKRCTHYRQMGMFKFRLPCAVPFCIEAVNGDVIYVYMQHEKKLIASVDRIAPLEKYYLQTYHRNQVWGSYFWLKEKLAT